MAARTKKIKHDEKTKDEIRGTQLINMLTQVGLTGKYNGLDVDPVRIQAARSALPFLRSTFSSVEQTVVNTADAQSEQDILSKLNDLVKAHPGLLDTLIGLRAQAKVDPVLQPVQH